MRAPARRGATPRSKTMSNVMSQIRTVRSPSPARIDARITNGIEIEFGASERAAWEASVYPDIEVASASA